MRLYDRWMKKRSLRPIGGQDCLIGAEWAGLRNFSQRQVCLKRGKLSGFRVLPHELLVEFGPQAWAFFQQFPNFRALVTDGKMQTNAPPLRLITPFQQERQQVAQTATQFSPETAANAFEFFGNIHPIKLCPATMPQELGVVE